MQLYLQIQYKILCIFQMTFTNYPDKLTSIFNLSFLYQKYVAQYQKHIIEINIIKIVLNKKVLTRLWIHQNKRSFKIIEFINEINSSLFIYTLK